ncbi:hypothetical protein PAXRUDRAFT_400934 [Paxillus rubicundulus Ve08.2h10]|uniref:Uncharacterized protein n=1 Tax=Paxillus rubicundulus Ve08.2h10 TaxID=930991 RepID=A0A0D0DD42_9AGAM|nr:hypothetical protein PAXRUDRAFT_400934 [Paxillus rubicundulus Ve08.2h10]
MKFTTMTMFTALLASCAYASPAPADTDVATHTTVVLPSGIPVTSGLPFSTLPFDTTAASSLLSSLSFLISSQSVAVTPALPPPTSAPPTYTTNSGAVVVTSVATISTPTASATPSQTGAAVRMKGVKSGIMAGVVVGAVAALL